MGGVKYIHLVCLQQWLKTKSILKNSSNKFCITYTLKQTECEICKTILPDYLKHNNHTYDIWDFLKPDFKNYIMFETCFQKQTNKTIYIITFDEKNIVKIGRSNDSDVRMSDISVSRFHCNLKLWDNGNITISDNKSKFGTLILFNHPYIPLFYKYKLTVQIGRSLFKLYLKSPCFLIKLFTCWTAKEILTDFSKLNSESISKENYLNIKIQNEKSSFGSSSINSLKNLTELQILNDLVKKNINSKDECNTSHKQENSIPEDQRLVQLPAVDENRNIINKKNLINEGIDEYISKLNNKFKNKNLQVTEFNNDNIQDPNYIEEYNKREFEKIANFKFINDLLNNTLNNPGIIENGLSKKITSNNENIKRISLINSVFENNLNEEINRYERYSSVNNNRNSSHNNYSRRKSSKIRSPKKLINKIYSEDNVLLNNDPNTINIKNKNCKEIIPIEFNLDSIPIDIIMKSPNEI